MPDNRLVLPFGTAPHLRGDAAAQESPGVAAQHLLLSPRPPTSIVAVGTHNDHIANVTRQANSDRLRLSHAAAAAAPPSLLSVQRYNADATSSTSSTSKASMFIRPRQRPKRPAKAYELQAMLDRNRNLLKSGEVRRLLSAAQLRKLEEDTRDLVRALQDDEGKAAVAPHEQGLEDVLMELTVQDAAANADGEASPKARAVRHTQSSSLPRSPHMPSSPLPMATQGPTRRGKAEMMSVEENAKLQRANFEAEREMERTREYELMGRQMGHMSLVTGRDGGKQARKLHNTGDEEDEVDVLGLGKRLDEAVADTAFSETKDVDW